MHSEDDMAKVMLETGVAGKCRQSGVSITPEWDHYSMKCSGSGMIQASLRLCGPVH